MQRFSLLLLSLILAFGVCVAAPEYPRDLTKWRESKVPPKSPQLPRMIWFYASTYSDLDWRVFTKDGKPSAANDSKAPIKSSDRPKFTPKVAALQSDSAYNVFEGGSAFAAVDDGWLVGFNQGEFGAALYWFSRDGKRNYKISNHQIVDFVALSNGLYAVEGLAHLSLSRGSVIRILRPKAGARWTAKTVTKLPFAPYAVSSRRDGTMLITLSDSLVAVGPDHKIRTLLADVPWSGLYPNSSVLSADEKKLYLGMRQFVGEFDLTTRKLRLLIPSEKFLNKLPKEEEEQIRNQYRG